VPDSQDRESLRELIELQRLISAELDIATIVQAVTDAATKLSRAEFGAFFYNVVDDSGERYTLYAISGVPREAFSKFPMPRNTAIFAPTFEGRGIVRRDDVREDPGFGQNPPYHGMPAGHLPVVSYLAVPVISRSGEVWGGLFFGHHERGVFTEEAEGLVSALAAQAAVSLDNARLMEAHRKAEKRARFLAECTQLLSASLDHEQTLQTVVQLAVPEFADWAGLDIVGADGRLQRAGIAAKDPALGQLVRDFDQLYPVNPQRPHGIANVARTGRGELYQDLGEPVLRRMAIDDTHFAKLLELGLRSAIAVPLTVQGRIVGTLRLVLTEAPRRYTPDDLEFAQALADRAAVAVEQGRLYKELKEAYATATSASVLKDEFLATLSHELRTPLNAILGWVQMLRSGALDADGAARALGTIARNAEIQSELINELLDVSRIVAGKMQLDVRPIDLVKVAELAVQTVTPAAAAKGVRLQPVVGTSPAPVSGDADRLQQVVWNLLSNAIKFTPKGGRVQIRIENVTSHVELTVADSGKGIPPQMLPHIFERFRQGDSSSTRGHGGLGLGLAIVRHLVELHGGTVEARSGGEGEGASIVVRLPRRAVEDSQVTAVRDGGLDAEARSLEGVLILVVDDNPDARDLVAHALHRAGGRTLIAGTAAEAMAALAREMPDIVVSDIEMPGEDGYGLLKKIRALPGGADVPVIALTAYARAEERVRALRAGFQVHLAKPVDPFELVMVVASQAGRNR
jgi:signal transduction histidine kinase/CheY-like chemotaxis protein